MFKALVKKQWLELTAPLRRSSATGRSRTGWKAAAFGVLMACLFGLVMVSVGVLDALLCPTLTEAGLDWLYFVLSAAPALLVGVIGGGMVAYSSLYAARDNEMLLSLPIPPEMILTVRMGYVWALGTSYLALLLVPAYGVYFVLGARPVGAALAMVPVMCLLGCLVLAVSCLVGWAAALLGGRITRYKAVLNAFYAVVVLVLAFGANFAVRQGLVWMLQNLDAVSRSVRTDARVVYLLGQAAAGDLPALGLLALAGLGARGVSWGILRWNYLGMMTARRGGARAVYREKPVRVRSVRAALLSREARRLAGCTSYMVNGTLACFMLPDWPSRNAKRHFRLASPKPCPNQVRLIRLARHWAQTKKEAATRADFLVKQMQNSQNAYSYLYSAQLFMSMSSSLTRQKAWMKALARRLLVMSGTLRSIAARRIL